MNKIHLIGRVVHTPEMKATKNGAEVCNFSIAVRRRFKNAQTGEYETDFFDVQAWRQLADLCKRYLEKGKLVCVVGSMQSRSYEKDGVKRKVWEVLADEVEFLSKSEGQSEEPAQTVKHQPPDKGFTRIEDEDLPF